MNSWLVWAGFAVAVVFLGWVAYHFTVRTLRFVTLALVVAGVVLVTRYGVSHPSPSPSLTAAPVDLVHAFTRGLDNLSGAFFQPLLPGPRALLPGRVGWLVIVVFLVFAYRELEVWAMRWQPPTVDTSALDGDKPGTQNSGGHARPGDSGPDGQRDHDDLVAELRFRLPAVEVRAPPLLPGGSTPNGLASVAENSGVEGSGLAAAIIRVVGMLWPSPRRYQVRVWVKPVDPPIANSHRRNGQWPWHASTRFANGEEHAMDCRRVTVDLADDQTGGSIATTTLAARDVDDAAARVAAYVARQIFRADPTTPPWCVGSFDGSDLAALISAKQRAELIHRPEDAQRARCSQIKDLDEAVRNSPGAGVARYELALLRDLKRDHVEALRLHALNRQQYPRFFRGRYRLGMSLEMIANPQFRMKKKDWGALCESLRILDQCGLTDHAAERYDGRRAEKLPGWLRYELLMAARKELREGRRQVTLWRHMGAMFWHRDERAARKPYWRLRERQRPHDAAHVAELLVAVRQRLAEQECACPPKDSCQVRRERRRAKRALHITAVITGDITEIEALLHPKAQVATKGGQKEWPQGKKAGKTRWLPWQRRTPSWQAAYNAACVYAALASSDMYKKKQASLTERAVASLKRAVNDRNCEMERPWDWISIDPDLRCLKRSPDFSDFLSKQRKNDYPKVDPDPDQHWHWAPVTASILAYQPRRPARFSRTPKL
jgi:hypothetical protein